MHKNNARIIWLKFHNSACLTKSIAPYFGMLLVLTGKLELTMVSSVPTGLLRWCRLWKTVTLWKQTGCTAQSTKRYEIRSKFGFGIWSFTLFSTVAMIYRRILTHLKLIAPLSGCGRELQISSWSLLFCRFRCYKSLDGCGRGITF